MSFRGREYPDKRHPTIVTKMPGQIRDWKVYCVCGGTHLTCNGGWMREIEDRARPILIPLIKGEEIRLSPADQSVIAAWAALKAIVGEYDERMPVTVHHTHRKYLMIPRLSDHDL